MPTFGLAPFKTVLKMIMSLLLKDWERSVVVSCSSELSLVEGNDNSVDSVEPEIEVLWQRAVLLWVEQC